MCVNGQGEFDKDRALRATDRVFGPLEERCILGLAVKPRASVYLGQGSRSLRRAL